MDRPVWFVFPYPDTLLRPIGNQSGLEMDQKLKNFKNVQKKEMPQKLLEEVLETALWAPSGMNKQDWELVVVHGKERDQLLEIGIENVPKITNGKR